MRETGLTFSLCGLQASSPVAAAAAFGGPRTAAAAAWLQRARRWPVACRGRPTCRRGRRPTSWGRQRLGLKSPQRSELPQGAAAADWHLRRRGSRSALSTARQQPSQHRGPSCRRAGAEAHVQGARCPSSRDSHRCRCSRCRHRRIWGLAEFQPLSLRRWRLMLLQQQLPRGWQIAALAVCRQQGRSVSCHCGGRVRRPRHGWRWGTIWSAWTAALARAAATRSWCGRRWSSPRTKRSPAAAPEDRSQSWQCTQPAVWNPQQGARGSSQDLYVLAVVYPLAIDHVATQVTTEYAECTR